MLYGHGLAAAGLDPARLLIVDTPSPSRRLAALDDILRTEGLTAVVIEYDGLQKSVDYWMRLARRAQLAAEQKVEQQHSFLVPLLRHPGLKQRGILSPLLILQCNQILHWC